MSWFGRGYIIGWIGLLVYLLLASPLGLILWLEGILICLVVIIPDLIGWLDAWWRTR